MFSDDPGSFSGQSSDIGGESGNESDGESEEETDELLSPIKLQEDDDDLQRMIQTLQDVIDDSSE